MLYILNQLMFWKKNTFVYVLPRSFKIVYFLRYHLKVKFWCQSCDVINPPKTMEFNIFKPWKHEEF